MRRSRRNARKARSADRFTAPPDLTLSVRISVSQLRARVHAHTMKTMLLIMGCIGLLYLSATITRSNQCAGRRKYVSRPKMRPRASTLMPISAVKTPRKM